MTRSLTIVFVALLFRATVTADETVNYRTHVRHVLQQRCFACHGVLKQESGLRLDTAASAIRGGDAGAAIVPGDSTASELVRRISATELSERMPPEGESLKPDEIAAIRRWIDQGAQAPADEEPESDPRDHWSFNPPVRPEVPDFKSQISNPRFQIENPIDAFIAATQHQHGLKPQPEADKRTWLRRVSLDLIGLPPTLAEQQAFLADDSLDAYDKVVTRLLESPHYGERWGRHWMDIWRYSDWWGLGAEVRNSQKHIWHWRDWIIESLNADKGYDQMLREMLAADELYPNDLDRLRASGFLARQYFKFNRTSWLDETVEHTAKSMLGLTFNCAKCHDHKYDPFSQAEYYQMRAFFEPYQIRTDAMPGETDFEKDGLPRAFDGNLNALTFLHIRGDDRNPDQSRALSAIVPAFLAFDQFPAEPVQLPLEASQPHLRAHVVDSYVKAAEAEVAAAVADAAQHPSNQSTLEFHLAELALERADLNLGAVNARAAADQVKSDSPDSEVARSLAIVAARAERLLAAAKAEEAAVRAELAVVQSEPEKKTAAEKSLADAKTTLESAIAALESKIADYTPLAGALKTLESNLETEESRRKPFPATSTGRRTALAKWITDPRHPLPARVAVNHLWSRHFGKALVPTLFDFGRKGTKPSHPELLDWLAVEFIESGWSMKHIHRLIVTSATYRMTSSAKVEVETSRVGDKETNSVFPPSLLVSPSPTLASALIDPENRFYWRMNPTRMEAQVVRDSLLHLAGELDLTMFGPSIPVSDATSRRRSLYFVHSHNEHQTFLSIFDDASVLECYRRSESIVPQQALALENSSLASDMASKIATAIVASNTNMPDGQFIVAAFRLILSTDPTPMETAVAVEAMSRFRASDPQVAEPNPAARALLILALLNHNDFVTIR